MKQEQYDKIFRSLLKISGLVSKGTTCSLCRKVFSGTDLKTVLHIHVIAVFKIRLRFKINLNAFLVLKSSACYFMVCILFSCVFALVFPFMHRTCCTSRRKMSSHQIQATRILEHLRTINCYWLKEFGK